MVLFTFLLGTAHTSATAHWSRHSVVTGEQQVRESKVGPYPNLNPKRSFPKLIKKFFSRYYEFPRFHVNPSTTFLSYSVNEQTDKHYLASRQSVAEVRNRRHWPRKTIRNSNLWHAHHFPVTTYQPRETESRKWTETALRDHSSARVKFLHLEKILDTAGDAQSVCNTCDFRCFHKTFLSAL